MEHRAGAEDCRCSGFPSRCTIARDFAEDVIPDAMASGVPEVPLVTHGSTTLSVAAAPSRIRRWVVDRGYWDDIIGECTLTDGEKNSIEDMKVPMRPNTANHEVVASKRLKAPLRSATSVDAAESLAMKDCPSILSLVRICLEHGLSFARKAGMKPVLKSSREDCKA